MMPNKKACRFFFGPSRKCNKGESCEYSHDPASQHSFSSGGPRGDFNANRLGGQGFHSKDYHPNNYSNNNQRRRRQPLDTLARFSKETKTKLSRQTAQSWRRNGRK